MTEKTAKEGCGIMLAMNTSFKVTTYEELQRVWNGKMAGR